MGLVGIVRWIVRSSAMASVLIFMILFIKILCRGHLKARWQYAIWFLVLLRLMVPYMPQSPVSIYNLLPMDQQKTVIAGNTAQGGNSRNFNNSTEGSRLGVSPGVRTVQKIDGESSQTSKFQIKDLFRYGVEELSAIWLIGTILFFVFTMLFNMRFRFHVKDGKGVNDKEMLALFNQCKETMGIKRNIPLIQSKKMKTPALFGVLKPRVLLPENISEMIPLQELRFVFLHELAHYKRKDIAVNWIMGLLQMLHWFNPIIWYAFYQMRQDREVACDALALSYIHPEECIKYGQTIISLLESFSKPKHITGMAGILESKSQIKRRIRMISLFKKNSYRVSVFVIILFILIGSVALTSAKGTERNSPKSNNSQEISPIETNGNQNSNQQMVDKKKNDKGGPLIIQEDNPIVTGIFDHVEDPVNKNIRFTNGWRSEIHGEMKGQSVIVGAGAFTDDQQRGVVLVRISGEDRSVLSSRTYPTPEKHGAVQITGYEGFTLSLKANDGYQWTFDVITSSFHPVDTKAEIIAKKQADQGPLIIQKDNPITTSIIDFVEDPIAMRSIHFTNGWRGNISREMEGKYVIVGAGAQIDDPKQGVVFVRVHGESGILSANQYVTPGKHGAVKVESYDGFVLKLAAEDGYKWAFDVPAHKFSKISE